MDIKYSLISLHLIIKIKNEQKHNFTLQCLRENCTLKLLLSNVKIYYVIFQKYIDYKYFNMKKVLTNDYRLNQRERRDVEKFLEI
jgi:hypothetical protein